MALGNVIYPVEPTEGNVGTAVPAGRTRRLLSVSAIGRRNPWATLRLLLTPSGGTKATLVKNAAIPDGRWVSLFAGDHVLAPGDQLSAQAAGANRVTLAVSYDEETGTGLRRFVATPGNAYADVATVPSGKEWRVLGVQFTGLYNPEALVSLEHRTAANIGAVILDEARVPDATVVPGIAPPMAMTAGERLRARVHGGPAGGGRVTLLISVDESDV